ncbi:MAG: hypothetical protein GTO05_17565, partial [Gemmatimonadales bacterium]|nr:hypothetical protein [Gemmatimonadales bacterium]
GLIALFLAFVSILVPLKFSEAGKTPWQGKGTVLLYFSCLGAGFIIIELTLIQVFMKLIGYPVYTYGTVVFTLLAAAGCGSYFAGRGNWIVGNRWVFVFVGIFVVYAVFGFGFPYLFDSFLSSGTTVRILVSVLMLAPLGFFLGVPFPMGIATLGRRKEQAVPWVWGVNGLFTVIGGLASVGLSLSYGFRLTLFLAIAIYGVAFLAYARVRRLGLVAS